MGTVLQDINYAARSFAKRPGFSLTVIMLVALGVGATTTIFSVVDNVLLRSLPYPQAERLVFFDDPAHSIPMFRDWEERTNSFAAIGAVWNDAFDLTGDGTPESVQGGRVTQEFFSLLGARPEIGRLFTPDDYVGIPAQTVVVSHDLWRRRWGGDPNVLGSSITVNGLPMEVVGVVNPELVPPVGTTADFWLPLDVTVEDFQHRGFIVLSVIAQLRSGTTLDAAQADVAGLSLALADEFPDFHRLRDGSPRMHSVIPLMQATVGDFRGVLWMLLGAVGLMLLIACANVANLFLARGADRTREVALRAALGAGRGRIVAQLLTESLVLALAGGVLGVVLAVFGVFAFDLYGPGGTPRMEGIAIDLRVLGFALFLSIATGMLFGIVPAITAARADVNAALSENASAGLDKRRPFKLRSALVVAELSMALVLLIGAGLLFRSFVLLSSVDVGFGKENVLVLPLEIGDRFEGRGRVAFTQDLLEQITAIPGVETVGASTTIPPTGRYMCCWGGGIRTDDQTDFDDPFSTIIHPVTLGYFETLGVRVLRGRDFTEADDDVAVGSVIINESVAAFLFADTDPIGQSFWFRDIRMNVIGVVNDIRHWKLNLDGDYNVYVPYGAYGVRFGQLQLAVKSAIDPTVLAGTLRETVWSIDGDLPVGEMMLLEQKVARSIAQPRFLSILFLTFATLAVMLAAGGVYGSMLYSVRQRYKEMGIRIALGAGTGDVVGMIVKSGLLITVIGLGLGIGGAYGLSRWLESLLFGITPVDTVTFVAVPLLLGVVAMTASYVPARKAAQADPIQTLRVE